LRAKSILFVVPLLAALAACSQTTGLLLPTSRSSAGESSPAIVEGTRAPLAYQDCAWTWASQDLQQPTSAFRGALLSDGLTLNTGGTYVYAFGENCLGPDGQVDHFAALETDFVVSTSPADPEDFAALGDYAAAVLNIILDDFGPGVVPGPQLGKVDFVFTTDTGEIHQSVLLTDAAAALQNGLTGAELFQTLFR